MINLIKMKLYATTTSERASKGQGGNDWLNIEILCGDAKNPEPLAIIRVENLEDATKLHFKAYNQSEGFTMIKPKKEKGNKQKGENPVCGRCYKREANKGDTLCEPCAKQNAY